MIIISKDTGLYFLYVQGMCGLYGQVVSMTVSFVRIDEKFSIEVDRNLLEQRKKKLL